MARGPDGAVTTGFAVVGELFITGFAGAVFCVDCTARGSTGRSSRFGRSSTFLTGFGFGFGLGFGSGLWITTGASFGGSGTTSGSGSGSTTGSGGGGTTCGSRSAGDTMVTEIGCAGAGI
ncbi:hypothetical protein D3C86_1562770 [compost metagenome]